MASTEEEEEEDEDEGKKEGLTEKRQKKYTELALHFLAAAADFSVLEKKVGRWI